MVARATLRAALFVGVLLAMWTLARPAAAEAPFCDDRGASASAPPPLLQSPGDSIQRIHTPGYCPLHGNLPYGVSIAPARRALAFVFSGIDAGLPPAAPAMMLISRSGDAKPAFETALVPAGVRSRVERPPRV